MAGTTITKLCKTAALKLLSMFTFTEGSLNVNLTNSQTGLATEATLSEIETQTNKLVFESDALKVVTQLSATAGREFLLRVQMGEVPGYTALDKFGVNQDIRTATDPEDIVEFGGKYVFDAPGTAPIGYLSCSDAADTAQTISISGLDINGNGVQQTVITNGQTAVALSTPLWRVYRMSNDSDDLTGSGAADLQGVAYCHTEPAPVAGVPAVASTRAIINGDRNQTLMAVYTVPRGKVGFLYRGEIGVQLEGNASALAEYAHCHYESRRYEKLFKVKKSVTCIVGGSAVYQDVRSFPDIIPALTDIRLRVIEVSQNMGLWGTFDMLLVDENQFSPEYLAKIGQPA